MSDMHYPALDQINTRIWLTVVRLHGFNSVTLGVLVLSVITLSGCEGLAVRDTASLLVPRFQRSEILGLVAGCGTTFAAVPDLVAMLKRRSSAGINPRMAGIMGVFQIVWVYYGLLILSRPVIAWNTVAVVINFLNVGAYLYFVRRDRQQARE
jgi:MtN3 and saliva related transmembrane protein